MKIATWNVNSVNARLPTVVEVLKTIEADVWCLQEIKCVDEKFPRAEMEELGFNCAVFGQKTYNGVAILAKHRISDEVRHLPGEPEDEQSRYLEVLVEAPRPVRVASVYLPNGNPRPGEKYDYKLRWMDRLNARAEALLANEEAVVLTGDFNCIPRDEDCWDPKAWAEDALAWPATRERSAACNGWATRTPSWRATGASRNTPSGTIRPAPGSGTTAFASTTPCSRRKRPTGSSGCRSIATSEAGRNRRTTYRW